MRFITGAIVVCAGSLLLGMAACANSLLMRGSAGSRWPVEMATYGGMIVIAAGLIFLIVAHRDTRQ